MIEIKEIQIEVKNFSLKDISLLIQSGTIHCLIGPTGCGKTTLLETLLGLRKIKKGKIILEGKDITHLPVHKRGFSYVPQDLAIFPHLTVQENIFFGIKYGYIKNKKEKYIEAIHLANMLGINHLLKRKAVDLSGGERQRVALARALASGQTYLLLDEPFSSLHEGMKKDLWFLLKNLQKKYNFTILMISHDLEETFFLADYISVMIDGKIQQSDKKDVVYHYPKNYEVAKFLGIKNIWNAEVVGIENGNYKFYCPAIKKEVYLPLEKIKNFTQKKEILFGIRSEDVIILRPDLPSRKENLVDGTIKEIFPSGSNFTILFEPHDSQVLIEIVMPEFAVAKLSAKPRMQTTVSLRAERLFILN